MLLTFRQSLRSQLICDMSAFVALPFLTNDYSMEKPRCVCLSVLSLKARFTGVFVRGSFCKLSLKHFNSFFKLVDAIVHKHILVVCVNNCIKHSAAFLLFSHNKRITACATPVNSFLPAGNQSFFYFPQTRPSEETSKNSLTFGKTYGYTGGRVETSYIRGCSAPIDFAGFFISDFVGSAATYLNKPTCRISGFQLPTPHGLRDFETRIYEMQNQIVVFNQQNIELIRYNNQDYMTLSQIASALEYNNSSSINDILNRNKSEFDENMTCLIKHGRTRVRIFNREGAWLVGMLSHAPRAPEFRRWVLKVLKAVTDNQPVTNPYQLDAKAVGGLVKKCAAVAVREELVKAFDDLVFRENIRSIVREAVRDEVADYLLKDGVKEGTFNSFPTADGLPAISWVMSISHGATALYNLIQQYQKRQKEAVALLESKKC